MIELATSYNKKMAAGNWHRGRSDWATTAGRWLQWKREVLQKIDKFVQIMTADTWPLRRTDWHNRICQLCTNKMAAGNRH